MSVAAAGHIPRPLPWWTGPTGLTLGLLLPLLFLIAYAGSADFPGLTARGIPFLSAGYVLLGGGVLLAIGLSGWIGAQIALPGERGADAEGYRWDRAATVVGSIALMAYLVFFKDFVLSPVLLLKTLSGAYRPDRTNLELTVGVTSLENFAPVFFSIYAFRTLYQGTRVRASLHVLCAVLLLLTALRVYAWSERLALIEAAVPFGLSGAARLGAAGRRARRVTGAGPILALPAFVLYFGAAEYVRSWTSATYHGRSGFWEFAIGRLASYYYTSLNNGAGLLATARWPTFHFEYTLWWLHKAPVLGPVFSSYVGLQVEETGLFLQKYGDLEFNNPSGIYSVIFDIGLPLGIAYFGLQGAVGGLLFRAFRAGSYIGALGYPLLYLSMLEIFRYPYLGAPRGFTWAVGIAVAIVAGIPWSSCAHVSSVAAISADAEMVSEEA
jgi:hypothetical protein